MFEDLNLDNILSNEEIEDLFDNNNPSEKQDDNPDDNKDDTIEVTEGDILQELEGVDSKSQEREDTKPTNSGEDSPKQNNFYSSIATAAKEAGIFSNLDDSFIESIKTDEDLENAFEQEVQARLDETQKRVNNALNAGVEPDEIKYYENTIQQLRSITEEQLRQEDEQSENLRRQLIYLDLINRGKKPERAKALVEKSIKEGTDIEDALDALEGNKEFYQDQYNQLLDNAKERAKQMQEEQKKKAEKLKKSILEEQTVFGDIQIDKPTRQKVFDNISKPVYTDKETGNRYTELQKYQYENPEDFLKYVGLLFTLTDKFTNLDRLVNPKVNKQVKKGFKDLERKLSNSNSTFDGKLNFASGVSTDKESFLGKNWKLDI